MTAKSEPFPAGKHEVTIYLFRYTTWVGRRIFRFSIRDNDGHAFFGEDFTGHIRGWMNKRQRNREPYLRNDAGEVIETVEKGRFLISVTEDGIVDIVQELHISYTS